MVGLLAVSCSKENIRPISTENEETPVWRSSSTTENGNGSNPSGPGSITDPNNDEDGGKRKRQ